MSKAGKKITIMFLLCAGLIILGVGSVSAANVTVTNSTSGTDIQSIISGTHSKLNLGAGETLTLNEGNYYLSDGLKINRSINIVGNGSVKLVGSNTNTNGAHGINIAANYVNITGLSIYGFNRGIQTNATGTKVSYCEMSNNLRGFDGAAGTIDLILYKNKFSNNIQEGMDLNVNRATITDNTINGNGLEGIHGSVNNTLIAKNIITNNGFGNNNEDAAGVDLHYHGNTTTFGNVAFENNIVSNNKGNGVRVQFNDTLVNNNKIYDNGIDGVDIEGHRNTVSNNAIYNNRNNGIINNGINTRIASNDIYRNYIGINIDSDEENITAIQNTIIKSNKIHDNMKNGIIIEKGTNSILYNNKISNNGDSGILLNGNSNKIGSNIISDNINNGIENNAEGTQIINNKFYGNTMNGLKNQGTNALISKNTGISNPNDVKNTQTKKVVDIKITKVVKKGNTYYIVIKNSGTAVAGKSYLGIYVKNKLVKKVGVSTLNAGKSKLIKLTLSKKYKNTVKTFKVDYRNKINNLFKSK